jgi:hypothetical protein
LGAADSTRSTGVRGPRLEADHPGPRSGLCQTRRARLAAAGRAGPAAGAG